MKPHCHLNDVTARRVSCSCHTVSICPSLRAHFPPARLFVKREELVDGKCTGIILGLLKIRRKRFQNPFSWQIGIIILLVLVKMTGVNSTWVVFFFSDGNLQKWNLTFETTVPFHSYFYWRNWTLSEMYFLPMLHRIYRKIRQELLPHLM